MNNSWKQPPVEESQRQFIPLQAVKQQRNRLLGAPLQVLGRQHGIREWPYQQQNPPLLTESTSTNKVTKHSHLTHFVWITDGKSKQEVTGFTAHHDPWHSCGGTAPIFLIFWH
jgi:hypothetical protein